MEQNDEFDNKQLKLFEMEAAQKEREKKPDHVPDCVIMIRPTDFRADDETAVDNIFQKKTKLPQEEILKRAQKEFDEYVKVLREKGVKVIVIDKSRIPELSNVQMPDGVFPNWFTIEPNGVLVVYSMEEKVRDNERKLLKYLERALFDEGYKIRTILVIGSTYDPQEHSLEGTGALVFDRVNKIIYSGNSRRAHRDYFNILCELLGYRGVNFDTAMTNGDPFYHTDLYLVMGHKFAVVCLDAIKGDMREVVKKELTATGKEIIEISLDQVENSFCGNLFEIRSKRDDKKYLVMSKRAHSGFTEDQLSRIAKFAEPLVVDLDIIECVGGGSARCMLNGNYLPKISDKKPANADVHPIDPKNIDCGIQFC